MPVHLIMVKIDVTRKVASRTVNICIQVIGAAGFQKSTHRFGKPLIGFCGFLRLVGRGRGNDDNGWRFCVVIIFFNCVFADLNVL